MPRKPDMPCGVYFCPVPLRLLWPVKALGLVEIAALYGCSRAEVRRRVDRLGIFDARPHRRTPVYSVSAFRQAWLDPAMSKPKIGAQFGMTRQQVWVHAKALGLPARKDGRAFQYVFGPEFEAMWTCGVVARDIARHVGCSTALVGVEARRRGLPKRARSMRDAKTLAEYRELQLAHRLAASARETAAALERRQMIDPPNRIELAARQIGRAA